MKLVLQRVARAQVSVGGEVVARIGRGLLALVGIARGDTPQDVGYLARKSAQLRVFDDEQGRLNRALDPAEGAFLVVSQFTLHADCRHGNRPSYVDAAPPEEAAPACEAFARALEQLGFQVHRGRFQEHMQVELVNDGPVTVIMESHGRVSA